MNCNDYFKVAVLEFDPIDHQGVILQRKWLSYDPIDHMTPLII